MTLPPWDAYDHRRSPRNGLSILRQNLDSNGFDPITVRKVRHHDLKDRLIKQFLENVRVLQPMEMVNFVFEERDRSGGTGANFVVEWDASTWVTNPNVEAVMIGTSCGQGISFVTNGKVIRRLDADAR